MSQENSAGRYDKGRLRSFPADSPVGRGQPHAGRPFTRTGPALGDIIEGKDIEAAVTARLNQDHFRNLPIDLYDGRCCVTGLGVRQLLVASHIKPWRDADPLTERVNVENGLLLNSIHDAAFDKGLIALDDDYRIVMSRELEKKALSDESEALKLLWSTRGRRIRLPERHKPSRNFIEYHQDVVFLG